MRGVMVLLLLVMGWVLVLVSGVLVGSALSGYVWSPVVVVLLLIGSLWLVTRKRR